MTQQRLNDQDQRDQALDISESYSVQAPAGSGKTELLTLRYLNLLAVCEQPEQVLAITFTRKAASEMRDRIVQSLFWARAKSEQGEPQFDNDIDARRFEIAGKVLRQDALQQWHILEHPARFRVQTIDSFCHYLSTQLPVLSRLGGRISVTDEVDHIYLDAVRETLGELNTDSPLSDDIAQLMQHYDNDSEKIERLLASLLANRDQWLPHMLGLRSDSTLDQDYLRNSLQQLICESLEDAIEELLPFENDLVELANFAGSNLLEQSKISDFTGFDGLPEPDSEAINKWNFLVELLLKKDNGWRKTVNVNNGFPASDKQDKTFDGLCKARKKQMLQLLETLAGFDDLLESLAYIRLLPEPGIEESQWGFLSCVARVLVALNARLLLSFRKFRTIDFTQTGAAARDALFDSDAPTDLALALDHKIQHVLVDEFQDTSQLQVDILEQLISGWQPGDGRTLFVVGDAMQSCYGFRNANVGLFLKLRTRGLGDLALIPLTLQTNFRSQAGLVDWVNTAFASAFPQQANPSRGAVPFTSAVAYHDALPDSTEVKAVTTELLVYEEGNKEAALEEEATQIADKIIALRNHSPDDSIAILVRNRTHLARITAALRRAGITWQSNDIDHMASLPAVNDLLSLTRAVLNPADRVAWLAVLRAPWCGLTMEDLFAVTSYTQQNSIWIALQHLDEIEFADEKTRSRLRDVSRILTFALNLSYRTNLRQLIEATWTLLRGACALTQATEAASVAQFFQLLDDHGEAGAIKQFSDFERKVAKAYIPTETVADSAGTVHLMTMHKAKGLEFDHVILPGLAHKTRTDTKALLQWHERLNLKGQSRLFLATLSASGADDDPLYLLLRYENQRKMELEATRLLYIAITRARKHAYLFATLQQNVKGEIEPTKSSLLYKIWRELKLNDSLGVYRRSITSSTQENKTANMTGLNRYPDVTPIIRFDRPLTLPADETQLLESQLLDSQLLESGANNDDEPQLAPSQPQTYTAEQFSTTVGTLIHQSLESLVKHAVSVDAQATRKDNLHKYWRAQLQSLGLDKHALADTINFIEASVFNSLNDSKDNWIFDSTLEDSATELALHTHYAGGVREYIVDRTFVDNSGTRWVIDYKTAPRPDSQSEEEFIENQRALHEQQLTNYKLHFQQIQETPVKAALFLTSVGKLVELDI